MAVNYTYPIHHWLYQSNPRSHQAIKYSTSVHFKDIQIVIWGIELPSDRNTKYGSK